MKLLHKLLSSVVILAITATVSAYILTSTLLNARYLESKAETSGVYDSVSQALPHSLVRGETPEALVARQALADTISSTYVKTKLNPLIESLQAHYSADAPAPSLDLSDLSAEVNRQGFQVPPDSPLDKPITIPEAKGAKTLFSWLNFIKVAAPVIGLLLLTLLMLINKGWDRFKVGAKICFGAAFSEMLVFILFKFTPSLLDSFLKSTAKENPLIPVLISFFKSVLAGVANNFGIAAVLLAVLGVVIILAGLLFKAAGALSRHTGGGGNIKDRFDRPNSDNRPTVN